MKKTSTHSFNSVDDLIVFTYATHSRDSRYKYVADLLSRIYPTWDSRYKIALKNAQRR